MKLSRRIWLADAAERQFHGSELLALEGYDWITTSARDGDIPHNIDLVIVTDERALPWIVPALRRCRERDIPSLHVVDGIVDWRNCFDNPTFDLPDAPAPTLFRPVVADKIACLGLMQCLILEHFSNPGRPELTGSLRLDEFARKHPPRPSAGGGRHLLITTARTPCFNKTQREALLRLLAEIRDWLAGKPSNATGLPLQATWRLPREIAQALHLKNQQTSVAGGEFHAALAKTDVLLSTSSTTLLEGMLAGVPTVLLDHTNTPAFVEAAWALRPGIDPATVILDALNPPPGRKVQQDFLLRLNLLAGDAVARTRTLIDTMIEAGRGARATRTTLRLPARILPWPAFGSAPEPAGSEPAAALEAELLQLRRQWMLAHARLVQLEREASVRLRRRILAAIADKLRKVFRHRTTEQPAP